MSNDLNTTQGAWRSVVGPFWMRLVTHFEKKTAPIHVKILVATDTQSAGEPVQLDAPVRVWFRRNTSDIICFCQSTPEIVKFKEVHT